MSRAILGDMLAAIVTAAGSGTRFGGEKILAPVLGTPLIHHTIRRIRRIEGIGPIVLVLPPDRLGPILEKYGGGLAMRGVTEFVAGGATRQESVGNGLAAVPARTEIVLVHDAVRPLFSVSAADRAVAAARETGAAIVAVPARDTLKRVDDEQRIAMTVPREEIWQAETPQVATRDLLEEAYRRAAEDGFTGTDEASLLERIGVTVSVVRGDPWNVKVTEKEDVRIVTALLEEEGGA